MGTCIVLIGPQGVGKGTQAQVLHNLASLIPISSGELFRLNLEMETPLGILAKGYRAAGELVPNDVTLEMISTRIAQPDCGFGYTLDGFPRTLQQALALDAWLMQNNSKVDVALSFVGNIEDMVARIILRINCHACNGIFSLSETLTLESPCPKCHELALYQRPDDNEENARKRLAIFQAESGAILKHYAKQNKLITIDGSRSIPEVTEQMLNELWGLLPTVTVPTPLQIAQKVE